MSAAGTMESSHCTAGFLAEKKKRCYIQEGMWVNTAVMMYEHLRLSYRRCVCAHMYLWQLRHNEAELMIAEKLPEGQSLIGAMHQLLDALQGHFLIDLGLGWIQTRKHKDARVSSTFTLISLMFGVLIFMTIFRKTRRPALITHCDISSGAPAGPAESWLRQDA